MFAEASLKKQDHDHLDQKSDCYHGKLFVLHDVLHELCGLHLNHHEIDLMVEYHLNGFHQVSCEDDPLEDLDEKISNVDLEFELKDYQKLINHQFLLHHAVDQL